MLAPDDDDGATTILPTHANLQVEGMQISLSDLAIYQECLAGSHRHGRAAPGSPAANLDSIFHQCISAAPPTNHRIKFPIAPARLRNLHVLPYCLEAANDVISASESWTRLPQTTCLRDRTYFHRCMLSMSTALPQSSLHGLTDVKQGSSMRLSDGSRPKCRQPDCSDVSHCLQNRVEARPAVTEACGRLQGRMGNSSASHGRQPRRSPVWRRAFSG